MHIFSASIGIQPPDAQQIATSLAPKMAVGVEAQPIPPTPQDEQTPVSLQRNIFEIHPRKFILIEMITYCMYVSNGKFSLFISLLQFMM